MRYYIITEKITLGKRQVFKGSEVDSETIKLEGHPGYFTKSRFKDITDLYLRNKKLQRLEIY